MKQNTKTQTAAKKGSTAAKKGSTAAKKGSTAAKKGSTAPTIKVIGKVGVKVNNVVFLKEGVSRKQLQDKVIEVNKSHKKEVGGYMYCLKQVIKHENGFLAMINLTADELLAGVDLEKYLTPHQSKMLEKSKCETFPKGRYSVWMLEQLIKKYAANKAAKK